MAKDAYDALMAHQYKTEALAQIAGRLGWDQETIMPKGAGAQRTEEIGVLESVLYTRRTDPKIGEWLAQIDDAAMNGTAAAQLRHIRRRYARTVKLPEDLVIAQAKLSSRAHGLWAEAREADDVAQFLPVLREVIDLKRQEAQALAEGGDLYDALLQDYEPGTTGDQIAAMFDRMRGRLVALRERIIGADVKIAPLQGHFPEAGQMILARYVADRFGYDFRKGRIDKAVHPFSSGSGADVRITTRVDEDDPLNCLYSTIHEVGHGAYEQQVDPEFAMTPLGAGASMGVHESQSRIYENQIGRSRAFTRWIYTRMQEIFGHAGTPDAESFYRAVNRVHSGYIRTESDEVHYNLHIMMRFDLERDLIRGALNVDDLEEAWNTRFASDFGVVVDRPSNGMLQDVHWAVGLFGYFPTYTLGNVYAGCLHKALGVDVPDLDIPLARGMIEDATDWLRDKVQVHGGYYEPREVIEEACGFAPDEGPLLDYLDAKFGDIYGV